MAVGLNSEVVLIGSTQQKGELPGEEGPGTAKKGWS